MRNRPGKRERQRAAKADRMAIVSANVQAGTKVERPLFGAPRGFTSSLANRDTLKAKSHDIGFVGPRGFYTPSETTPKDSIKYRRENTGAIVSNRRQPGERDEAVALASIIKGWTRPAAKE